MAKSEIRPGFIKTALSLGAIVGLAGVVNAGEVGKRPTPELQKPQTGQTQVEQHSGKLKLFTADKNFEVRANGKICDALRQLSDGRDVEIANIERRETLLCVFPKGPRKVISNK